MTAPRAAEEPWLGLLSYTTAHRELFFGRGKETEVLLRMIRREPLTTVFGPSGTGKTSLLNAAIAPQLAREDYLPVYIRLDHNPGSPSAGRQIRAAIDKEVQSRGLDPSAFAPAESDESAWEYLHRVELWNADNNPVTPLLVFDQFEEAFTIGAGRPETAAFFAELADLVENYTPAAVRDRLASSGTGLPYPQVRRYKIVLSLREDYVHKLDGLRKLMPSIMQNRFALTRMTTSQAMEAVLKPGAGLVTEDVAREIVTFVAGAPSANDGDVEVEPALLSVVCRELNFRRIQQGTPVITSEQVALSSADVLKDFYERSFDEVPDEARNFVEDRLLTTSGFRSTAPEEDAIKAGVSADVIRTLEDRRIIRREQRLRIAHVELTHDLLTRVVRESRDARHERLRAEQERLEQEEREAKLLREKQEQEARLKASRKLTMVMAAAAIVCVLLSIVALKALFDARAAARKAKKAEVRFYEERASNAYDRRDDLRAWAYTLEALSTAPEGAPVEVSAGRLLLPELQPGQADFQRSYTVAPATHVAFDSNAVGIEAAALSGNVVADSADKAVVLKREVNQIVCTVDPQPIEDQPKQHYSVEGVVFRPAGDLLAVFGDGTIGLASSRTCQPIGKRIKPPTLSRIRQIAFSADGAILAAAAAKSILFWDVRVPERTVALKPPVVMDQRPVSAVAFNPPGSGRVPNILAAGYEDGGVCWWDLSSASPKRTCGAGRAAATRSVSIAPDLSMIASGHNDAVRLWDFTSGRLLARIDETHPVDTVAFSRDGKTIGYHAGAADSATLRRLFFNRTFWDAPVDLAAFIRNPWSPENRAALEQWKARSERTLGYHFVESSFATADEERLAETARRWFRHTATSESIASEKNTILRGNPAAAQQKFPRWNGEELLMVPDQLNGAAAVAFEMEEFAPPFIVEFEFSIRNAGGVYGDYGWESLPADGISVMVLKNFADYKGRDPQAGGYRGVVRGSGYAIHFNIFEQRSIYLEDLGVREGDPPRILMAAPQPLMFGLPDLYTDGQWRKVRITVEEKAVSVDYEGVRVLEWEGTMNTTFGHLGFGAANGAANADHRFRNVTITIPKQSRR